LQQAINFNFLVSEPEQWNASVVPKCAFDKDCFSHRTHSLLGMQKSLLSFSAMGACFYTWLHRLLFFLLVLFFQHQEWCCNYSIINSLQIYGS